MDDRWFRLGDHGRYPSKLNVPKRFSIYDLMTVTTFVVAVIAWAQVPEYKPPNWNDLFLAYTPPAIPDEFDDAGRSAPRLQFGLGEYEYDDGAHLYRDAHFGGWQLGILIFIENADDWHLDAEPPLKPRELSASEWNHQHHYSAELDGKYDGFQQIQGLLHAYPESELRTNLQIIPWYRPFIRCAIPLTISIMLIFLTVVRIVRVRRNDG